MDTYDEESDGNYEGSDEENYKVKEKLIQNLFLQNKEFKEPLDKSEDSDQENQFAPRTKDQKKEK